MPLGFRSGLFAETEDYETRRPGGSDDWLLILTLAGRGLHRNGADTIELRPGTVLLYGPGVSQWYGTASAPWELIWTHFPADGRLEPWLDWPRRADGTMLLSLGASADEVERAMRELVGWQSGPAPDASAFAFNALERALLWCDRANPSAGHVSRDKRVDLALTLISDNLAENVSMTRVAQAVGLSRSRLAHLFRTATGMSLPEYVEARRIQKAEDLLRMTNRPVKEIARMVGFADPLYFSKRFTRRNGASPRAWRQSLTTQEDDNASSLA